MASARIAGGSRSRSVLKVIRPLEEQPAHLRRMGRSHTARGSMPTCCAQTRTSAGTTDDVGASYPLCELMWSSPRWARRRFRAIISSKLVRIIWTTLIIQFRRTRCLGPDGRVLDSLQELLDGHDCSPRRPCTVLEGPGLPTAPRRSPGRPSPQVIGRYRRVLPPPQVGGWQGAWRAGERQYRARRRRTCPNARMTGGPMMSTTFARQRHSSPRHLPLPAPSAARRLPTPIASTAFT
jgi:hypothetical protein